MIRLQGTVTAVSPIAVTYPEHTGLPRTPHGEVMLYGGTFRGPLRKAAYRAVRAGLAQAREVEQDAIFSLRDAYMLGEGVDTTRETNNEDAKHADPVGIARVRERNPLINLFGRWKLAGRLAVGELRTDQANVMTVGAGARADMFERDTQEVQYLAPDQRDTLFNQLENAYSSQRELETLKVEVKTHRREATAAGKSGNKKDQKALNKKIETKEQRQREIKDERIGPAESIKHPLAGFEAIAPGSELSHAMTLIEGAETDLGLLVMALAEFARHPFLGAHRHNGLGEIMAQWDVLEWRTMDLEPVSMGTIKLSTDGLVIEGDMIKAAYETFVAALDDYDFQVYTTAQARSAA